ncbi:hypothetical protein, partial [Microcystis aeruginosa]|uniref:hypothetical protein n=1 Tax=Microcystis aeruginosa TaxID=1126 RepID=UPI001C12B122
GELRLGTFSIYMAIILAKGENSCPLRNVTNYMGTLRKVKGVHPLMDKGFQLLWYICMGEVQKLVPL